MAPKARVFLVLHATQSPAGLKQYLPHATAVLLVLLACTQPTLLLCCICVQVAWAAGCSEPVLVHDSTPGSVQLSGPMAMTISLSSAYQCAWEPTMVPLSSPSMWWSVCSRHLGVTCLQPLLPVAALLTLTTEAQAPVHP